ncbi:CinA family protein [Neptuniibacter caesariensis]|uniref:CinA, C-terminal n=1 Tax=Neptuniibacter caesariensis TaxID=207954 RepID=A0A7U8C7N4_NEPCE|nr:CinA family protein [Neptuniibacter caesariensis]EAR63068.1 CinA, C-terminal [Oceanospirillum sp. MED92] [Neptuniibacter caesariensis]
MENTGVNSLTEIADRLINKNHKIATAESCTGGWIAQEITALPGSSEWFDSGFVTYSNQSKKRLLGVKSSTLEEHGAVSEQTVLEMAEGALRNSDANYSVVTSGIAGPGGGTSEKPVGTVWIAWAGEEVGATAEKVVFKGDRESVRKQAVNYALEGILRKLLA